MSLWKHWINVGREREKKIQDMHNLQKPSETLLDMMTLLIFLWSSQIYSITVINLVSLIAHPSNVMEEKCQSWKIELPRIGDIPGRSDRNFQKHKDDGSFPSSPSLAWGSLSYDLALGLFASWFSWLIHWTCAVLVLIWLLVDPQSVHWREDLRRFLVPIAQA